MTDLRYRRATIDDVARLRELEQGIIDSERPYDPFIKTGNPTYYDMEKLVTDADTYVMVVESDSGIVACGYAQVRPSKVSHTHDEHCYLGFIYVEPEQRGKGVGRMIVDKLMDWGKKQGLKHFQLDVYSENESAIGVYQKAGFSKIVVKMELNI